MRVPPVNMQAALANTHQTKHNNADPSIICDLTYDVSAFGSWASLDWEALADVSQAVSAWSSLSGVSHVTIHPTLGTTDDDLVLVVYKQSPTPNSQYGLSYQVYRPKDGAVHGGWAFININDARGSSEMTLAINGSVQQGPSGPEFVTTGDPVLFSCTGGNIIAYQLTLTVIENPDFAPSVSVTNLGNVATGDYYIPHVVCPAVLGQPAPGLYIYARKSTSGEIWGSSLINGTPGTAQLVMSLSSPYSYAGRYFSAGVATDGRVVLDIYDSDIPHTTDKVQEIWSTVDPLTFDAPTDITSQYQIPDPASQSDPPAMLTVQPCWMLFFRNKIIQRIGVIPGNNVNPRAIADTCRSTTRTELADYATATWSSWLTMTGQRASSYLADLKQYPDGTLSVLDYDQGRYAGYGNYLHMNYGFRDNKLHLGKITADGSISMQNDNAISQLSLTVQNNDLALLTSEDSPMRPGTTIDVALKMGTSDKMALISARIDEANIDIDSNTYTISARNLTGYNLAASSFDTKTTLHGSCDQMAAAIFALAGITRYECMQSAYVFDMTFDAKTTALEALNKIADYFTTDALVFRLQELPDGLMVFGYQSWINANYQSTGYYDVDMSKAQKRSIRRNADASYFAVQVSGKDSADQELTPCTALITNFDLWAIPEAKYYYTEAPGALTQEKLQDYADNLAASMSRAGITQTIRESIKPQLLVGDVVRDTSSGETVVLGIITSVRHRFGASGFYTEYTLDSGGVVEAGGDVTQTRSLNGYTRKQSMVDIMSMIANKSK